MGRTKDVQAAIDRTLQQIVGIPHILLRDVEVGHDAIDRNLQRVEGTPVIVKYSKCFAEILVGFLEIPIHEVSLNQDAVELDGLCVEGTNIMLAQSVKTVVSFVYGLEPLFLIHCHFTEFK